jgi:hypothetical protein
MPPVIRTAHSRLDWFVSLATVLAAWAGGLLAFQALRRARKNASGMDVLPLGR